MIYKTFSKNVDFETVLSYLLALFSTMQIISVFGVTVFNWLLMLFAVISVLRLIENKLPIINNGIIPVVVAAGISTFGGVIGNYLPDNYKAEGIKQFIWLLCICLVFFYLYSADTKAKKVSAYIAGFKLSCEIQIIWCVLQIISYYGFHQVLNDIVFNGIFHAGIEFTEHSVVCGLHWQRANLTPILVSYFFINSNIYIRILLFTIAVLSGSTTSQLLIVLCFLIVLVQYAKRRRIKTKQIIAGVFVLAVIGYLTATGVVSSVIGKIMIKFANITDNDYLAGAASKVHVRYYTALPYIFSQLSPFSVLFGTGLNSSGYAFQRFVNQYVEYGVWGIECDVAGTLIERGILGFILFYRMLLRMVKKFLKDKSKMAIIMVLIIIGGITYNVQFTWFMLFELVAYVKHKRTGLVFENERYGGISV